MRIILTHEQADFDALASLLGAHLLDERALPVLPRRMNRNVSAFITLYGLDLPFVDPRDLPKKKVDAVTLVDTQSLLTVKGMHARTQVHVIDHHPPRGDLPPDWTLNTHETGAATTILVEALQEQNGPLSVVQATLLLLGIYEDTGSLTYTRTTPRDVRAVAFLLEQGANLRIVTDFLAHPLSAAQQQLYDQLRAAAETHNINGHSVVVACGDATHMDEELSTLAHKLRDLLDPDALILLIATQGGVQLIARATTEYVDVAQLAAHFGGGGHPRAAAARIKGRPLAEVYDKLIETLPQYVHPAITVAEIMSHGPQLLEPNTPVAKAAEHMQRYGYEGYPVVEGGKVIGLLTRGAVDRAIAHKLNLKAADLMKAGEVVIHPHDSVETLQTLMTDTGWGQVPVVDPQAGHIIGIVTRTDLLKTLTPQIVRGARQNLADRLEAALPAARLALLKAVAQAARAQGAAFYIVGGFVRDLLLERPSLDYDLVVEGDAIALAKSLAKHYGGRVVTHRRFGTAKWRIAQVRLALADRLGHKAGSPLSPQDLPETIDLVSARREFYTHPTALPTVERGSIKLDLHRRDFTINTLALRLDGRHYGELHDYWGGLSDLHNGLIRVLHSLSFVDDPTRILRAVRFEQRFRFQIEERTLELLRAALPLLDRVSGDRIRHELNTILVEQHSQAIIGRLASLDILPAIHSDLIWDQAVSARLAALTALDPDPEWHLEVGHGTDSLQRDLSYILWLMCLPQGSIQVVSERLRLPAALRTAISAACALLEELPALADGPVSKLVSHLETHPPLARYAVYLVAPQERLRALLQRYVSEWSGVKPVTTGHDLRARGLPPGPHYKRILERLRAAWLDGEVANLAQELALLEKLLDG